MKHIGTTANGFLVELDAREYDAFRKLIHVVKGGSINGFIATEDIPSQDLFVPFTEMGYWLWAKGNANELRRIADGIDEVLGKSAESVDNGKA